MSWTDLLIEMDVLFVVPAVMAALCLAWQAGAALARVVRSSPAGLSYARPYGVSHLHRS